MSHVQTVPDPKLSLFQSAVAQVAGDQAAAAQAATAPPAAGAAAPSALSPMSAAAAGFAKTVESAIKSTGQPQAPADVAQTLDVQASLAEAAAQVPSVTIGEVTTTAIQCAKLAFQLGEAKLAGDAARASQLEAELNFNTCDPRWLEASEAYVRYFQIGLGQIPYRKWQQLSDFVLEGRLPDQATIGFIADWGTGTPAAVALLRQMHDTFHPDIVYHLGDIYYSGLQAEEDTFYQQCRAVLGDTPVFTLSGNHDMYSGGFPYYSVIDRLGQPASYFCLRNNHWQFLAMDTGLHDHNPNILQSIMTYLEPTEVTWHLDKIQNAAGRKTVLLSHHQLFTACTDIAGGPVNTRLQAAFQPVLPQIALWLWGHEHNMIQYGPYLGLERGRCIGCGAIPTFVALNPYKVNFPEVPILAPRLSNNGEIYDHGYAIMTLDGPNGQISYYQSTQPSVPLFTDVL